MKQHKKQITPPTPDRVRTLAALFLEGATTPAQEHELYRYYASTQPGSLPPDLENMRAMFAWYAGLSQKEPEKACSSRRIYLAVAASVAVLAAIATGIVGFGHFAPATPTTEPYATYSGSYVQRNGQRIDDIPVIYDDIVAAEQITDSLSRRFNDSTIIEQALRPISDPQEASQILTIIFE